MKIKIISSDDKVWYKDHIEETHNVIGEHSDLGYAVYNEDEGKVTKYVQKTDCVMLEPKDDTPFFLRTQRSLEDSFPSKVYVEDKGIFYFHATSILGTYRYGYRSIDTGENLVEYYTMNINLTHKMLIELACVLKYKYKVHF